MARPLVLNKTFHPVIWSEVYADVVVSTGFRALYTALKTLPLQLPGDHDGLG